MSPLTRASRGETVRDDEVLVRIPGQNDHLLSGNAQPVVGPDGRRLGAVLALHDITETCRAERFRDCRLAASILDGDTVMGVLACSVEAAEHDRTRITTLLGSITEQLGQFQVGVRAEQLRREVARYRTDFLALVGHEVRPR